MSSYTDKTYIVFLDLPSDIQSKIDPIRKKYSPGRHKKWPTHTTFKQDEDFLLSDSQISKITQDYFKNISSIKLTIDEPQIKYYLDNDNWNIHLAISGANYFKKCIKEFSILLEKFIDGKSPNAFGSTKWEQGDDFYPHISLKGGSSKEAGAKMFSEIINEDFKIDFPIETKCQSVTLAKWHIDQWQELLKIKLQDG
ncbi:MAG: hypothetical protein WCV92_01075 [Candidatus Buchananbacteria bacterium]